MTDYSEHLLAARRALRELEEAANAGRWHEMQAAAQELEENAEAIRFWAYSQPAPPRPTV